MKQFLFFVFILFVAQMSAYKANAGALNSQKLNKANVGNSVLSSGKWVKVSAKNRGMLKLTYEQLVQMGISKPENIAIFTNGGYMLPKMNNVSYPTDLQKIPVLHTKDVAGKNSIFFFCSGNVKWNYNFAQKKYVHEINLYSDKTYFYLTSDLDKSEEPKTIEKITAKPNYTTSTYSNFLLYEEELINLAKSGRRWFSDRIMQSSSKTSNFKLENPVLDKPAFITVAAAAKAKIKTYYKVKIGSAEIGTIEFNPVIEDVAGNYQVAEFDTFANSDLKITLTFDSGSSGADSFLDYIRINYISNLVFTDNQLLFRSSEALLDTVNEYFVQTTTGELQVFDVSNPLSIAKLQHETSAGGISFRDQGGDIKEYIIFSPTKGNFEEPLFIGNVKNQNIKGLPAYEMIIVSHPNFIEASEKLAQFHRTNDNLSVLVVTPEEIYNEFSSGLPDPAAIRNMLRHFYLKSNENDSLRYVLLMGDGSYNNRLYDGTKTNFIPTWQSVESMDKNQTFQSDDFYVLLDENEGEYVGKIDVGIGRIPCGTLAEANTVVNKIISYASPSSMGTWRNVVSFLADDEDYNNYPFQSEELIKLINNYYPGFYSEKIYFDAFPQISTSSGDSYPLATDAINRRVTNGSLILNYIGHANELFVASEMVLNINDVKNWKNYNALPIFVTATCEISRFDSDATTVGEHILLNPSGGGIALFTTTRVVYDQSNFTLSKNFYHNVFKQDKNGENLRMGDIIRLAKNATGSESVNMRKFALLGDPALQLAFPQLKVHTKSINDIDANTDDITIGALGKVVVKGYVSDQNGNTLADINGKVVASIYDKTVLVKTLDNDKKTGKYEYPIQTNVIYKGTSSVKNGEFEFTFIVPKDISYNIGKGKIFYYFSNDTVDGNGAFDNFNIGGTSPNPIVDNTPPIIDVFLNNEKFISGDKVSPSSLLIVNLSDESGINTVGTGIGHDIVAIIDGLYSSQIVLNDYYVSEADNFQKGKIIYPLNNLSPGKHTILIKVWDVQNNSVEKEISFVVEEGFEITATSNYPNPVDFYTNFLFRHNLPGDMLNAKIEIFNLHGVLLNEVTETINPGESTECIVRWETNKLKGKNQRQILIYRITLKNSDGEEAVGTGKFILNAKN